MCRRNTLEVLDRLLNKHKTQDTPATRYLGPSSAASATSAVSATSALRPSGFAREVLGRCIVIFLFAGRIVLLSIARLTILAAGSTRTVARQSFIGRLARWTPKFRFVYKRSRKYFVLRHYDKAPVKIQHFCHRCGPFYYPDEVRGVVASSRPVCHHQSCVVLYRSSLINILGSVTCYPSLRTLPHTSTKSSRCPTARFPGSPCHRNSQKHLKTLLGRTHPKRS